MLCIISPSKTQDPDVALRGEPTMPLFIDRTEQLVARLRQYDRPALAGLMKMSDKLAAINSTRFQSFQFPHTPDNSRQALFMFQGDQFRPMDRGNYTTAQLDHARQHLAILSGLYGMLRPLDLMQPHRLEMAVKMGVNGAGNLYEFWSSPVTGAINKHLQGDPFPVLVNLASAEYFRVVRKKELQADILTLSFKQEKAGTLKTIAIYAKRARGALVDYMITNRIADPAELRKFDRDGYEFSPDLSSEREWVFVRSLD
jgi:cytoplasmic iron level regulating protein YaaA (DUF328/UPF0246 family)